MSVRSVAISGYSQTHTISEIESFVIGLFGLDEDAFDGGEGSGNFGHAGNPGHVGGSKPKNGGRVKPRARESKTRETASGGRKAAMVKSYHDVTDEYKRKARPGKGKLTIYSGAEEERPDDVRMARWIHEEFGGDIRVLRESHEALGVKNPDYLWNGKLWDLKTPDESTYNAINKRTRKGIEQIQTNSGGIIMDLGKCGATIEEAEKAIRNRMFKSAENSADVIILHKDGKYKILRFE